MPQFTFQQLGEDTGTYYDEVHQDFHSYVSDIYFEDNGTFTVTTSPDFLTRVFYQLFNDGSGLCQNYVHVA